MSYIKALEAIISIINEFHTFAMHSNSILRDFQSVFYLNKPIF